MNYPKITNVFLVLTHRCNLACKYCFVSQEKLDMTTKTAFDSVDYIMNNLSSDKDSGSICFFGGEPLLKWDDIIVPTVLYKERMYPNKKCRFSITTNCVLLTEDKINFIKEHNIGVLTSIDGAKETQDFNRPFHSGVGSFDVVEKNIKKYKEIVGLERATFRSTIYPPTCDKLYENYLYAIELGYKTMFFIADSFSEWDEEHENKLRAELEKISDHYIEYWKKNKKPPITISPLIKHFGEIKANFERQLNGLPPLPCFSGERPPLGKCGYGQGSAAAIAPNGDLYGCQEMTSNEGINNIFYIGNIYEPEPNQLRRQQLKDIYNSTNVQGDMQCKDCPANIFCNGGCIANNYFYSKDMNHAAHGHCFFMRLVYDINKKIYEALRELPEFQKSISLKHDKSLCGNCLKCQELEDIPNEIVTDDWIIKN